MKHLMTIIEIKHLDINNSVLWTQKQIKNTIHQDLELFLLSVAFRTAAGITVPASYYAGLDNRSSIDTTDNFGSLLNEPNSNGYSRVAISSASGFTLTLNDDDVYQVTSSILVFTASGGGYGPVSNLFIGTTQDNTGYLLASGALNVPRTLTSGQKITVKIGLALRDGV